MVQGSTTTSLSGATTGRKPGRPPLGLGLGAMPQPGRTVKASRADPIVARTAMGRARLPAGWQASTA